MPWNKRLLSKEFKMRLIGTFMLLTIAILCGICCDTIFTTPAPISPDILAALFFLFSMGGVAALCVIPGVWRCDSE